MQLKSKPLQSITWQGKAGHVFLVVVQPIGQSKKGKVFPSIWQLQRVEKPKPARTRVNVCVCVCVCVCV